MENIYALYVWNIINGVQVSIARDASSSWNEKFQANIDAAKRGGFNYRVVRNGKTIEESIVK